MAVPPRIAEFASHFPNLCTVATLDLVFPFGAVQKNREKSCCGTPKNDGSDGRERIQKLRRGGNRRRCFRLLDRLLLAPIRSHRRIDRRIRPRQFSREFRRRMARRSHGLWPPTKFTRAGPFSPFPSGSNFSPQAGKPRTFQTRRRPWIAHESYQYALDTLATLQKLQVRFEKLPVARICASAIHRSLSKMTPGEFSNPTVES